jgi:hypothetical protein
MYRTTRRHIPQHKHSSQSPLWRQSQGLWCNLCSCVVDSRDTRSWRCLASQCRSLNSTGSKVRLVSRDPLLGHSCERWVGKREWDLPISAWLLLIGFCFTVDSIKSNASQSLTSEHCSGWSTHLVGTHPSSPPHRLPSLPGARVLCTKCKNEFMVFQKELHNFERLYKFIQRTCTVILIVIM